MPETIASQPTLGRAQRPLRRVTGSAVLGGVCGGLAVRFGVRTRTLRVLLCLSTLLYGVGALAYIAAWLTMTRSGETEPVARRLVRSRRAQRAMLVILLLSVVLLLSLNITSASWGALVVWSMALDVTGVVSVWIGATADERAALEGVLRAAPLVSWASARGWRVAAVRLVTGLALVVVGLSLLNHLGGVWGSAVPAVLGAAVLVIGVLVVLAPWWLQNVRDLASERRDRVRIEERAALAAHIHDSVLQTLTLIERAAENPREVVRLARAEERSLREWLFGGATSDHEGATAADAGFAAHLRSIQREVEQEYDVRVELVVVGDGACGDRELAILAAAREAVVNAAKWSRASSVAVFAELEADAASIYVRDKGVGFDLGDVPADRHGLSHSIRDRMERHGGRSEIRSRPLEGTEVELHIDRSVVRQ